MSEEQRAQMQQKYPLEEGWIHLPNGAAYRAWPFPAPPSAPREFVFRFFPDSPTATPMPRLYGRSFRAHNRATDQHMILTIVRTLSGIADDAIDDTRVGELVEEWHCRIATPEEAANVPQFEPS